MRVLPFCLLALLVIFPASASAEFDLTLATGVRSGSTSYQIEARSPFAVCITTPCVLADASTEDGNLVYSMIFDAPISRRFMIEALVTQQDGDLRLRSSFPPEALLPEKYDATTAQVGLLRHWGDGRLRPFAVVAVGGTRFESTANVYESPLFPGIAATRADEDVFSGSLAAGLKVDLVRHLGIRLEARGYWLDLPERLGGALRQSEGSVGVTYRW